MLALQVHLFAGARDRAGAASLTVTVPDGSRVADLRRALAGACPALGGLLARSVFAVNGEFAGEAAALAESDEIALLPPVSGG